jgi:hypothetical protein
MKISTKSLMNWLCQLGFMLLFLLLVGCSSANEHSEESAQSKGMEKSQNMAAKDSSMTDFSQESKSNLKNEFIEEEKQMEESNVLESSNTKSSENKPTKNNSMIIYNASLHIEVKNYSKVQTELEQIVASMGGYLVKSNVYHHGEQQLSGEATARVPQDKFHPFLKEVEKLSVKVYNRSISGKDVTEEYVDLESRLKSKRVVEERLLTFLEGAKKTEDLLRISNDLAKIQEEIEQVTGRMNYLQNQSALATVTIQMEENKLVVPPINKEGLNTWAKTKQAFAESMNGLFSFASSLFIFLIGYSPILILLGCLLYLGWRLYRKGISKKDHNI